MTEVADNPTTNWQRLPDMPVGKWEPASIVVDGKLYVLGGYEDGVNSSKRVDVFDPAEGTWTRVQDLPSAVSHLNLVADSTGFWFAGGMKGKVSPGKDHVIAEVWQLHLEKDRYIAAPLLPGPRAGGGLARIGDKLHYVSGLIEDRDTDAAEHWVLDLAIWKANANPVWIEAAPLPAPRNQFSTAVLNGHIYIIGGELNHDSQQLDQDRVDVYDPETDTWGEGPALPYGHSHSEGATFVDNDRIYIIGGHTTPEGGKKGFCGDVLVLNEGVGWTVPCRLPKPTSSPAAAIIDRKLYVAGGWYGRVAEDKTWLSSPEVWVTDVPG